MFPGVIHIEQKNESLVCRRSIFQICVDTPVSRSVKLALDNIIFEVICFNSIPRTAVYRLTFSSSMQLNIYK